MRVLIVPDKFKGTLTARAAAAAIAEGWGSRRPGDVLELLPMSDGGDGFGEIIGGALGGTRQVVSTVDSAGRACRAEWWWNEANRTAVIETAQVNGLALLPPGQFHPFELDTFGLGAVLTAAREAGARQAWLGIGGSATNDGGFGLARALSWRFIDGHGGEITRWTGLDQLEVIERGRQIDWPQITVAVDVQNPLLGPLGASRVYGPQKGLRGEDMPKAEACLGLLAEVCARHFGRDSAIEPGAGAAGGLGFGLMAFLGGRFESGADIFARVTLLEDRIRQSALVITGEGAIDSSSLMGKGVGSIISLAGRLGVPCLGLAGAVQDGLVVEAGSPGRLNLRGIVPDLAPLAAAKAEPARWLAALAAQCAQTWEP